jgi:two-component system phosphate regulon response regulator PhoB
MPNERILIIEDEKDILDLLKFNLGKEGYRVKGVPTGEEGLDAINEDSPDLILLDLMLPGIDGLEVCRRIRRSPEISHIPIIIVTAKKTEADIITGLELGANDYVTKPFSAKVLIARIRSILRQKKDYSEDDNGTIKIHNITIHPGRHEVSVGGRPVRLTPTEFRILHLMAGRPGWVFARYQIADAIHGEDYQVTDRSIDVQCVGLRKKLGDAGKYIETVRGVGYRLRDTEP